MPRTVKAVSKPRPLLVRPGARFKCFNDGLCCTDLHALGPMTQREVRDVRKIRPGSVIHHADIEAPCMATAGDGGCAQLRGGLCSIHADFGPEHKPSGCRRFPYGLVSTPLGGRITTESRCPCRTMGARPPLDPAEAEASLRDASGRLEVDQAAPRRVPMRVGKRISFEQYAGLEAGLLERLMAGERAERVLAATALPALSRSNWPAFAAEFFAMQDETAGGYAVAWFGDALLSLSAGHRPPKRPRPWAPSFARAARRAKKPADPESMIDDWVADELWMLRWLEWSCTFDVARAELATRVKVVRWTMRRLRALGLRADQAAAEAIMIAEMAACTEHWPEVVDAIANVPSPARELGPLDTARQSATSAGATA